MKKPTSKSTIQYFTVLLLLLFVNCATVVIAKPSAFQGRRFLVAFMQNEIAIQAHTSSAHFSIFISPIQNDTVTVILPNSAPQELILYARQIHEIKVPPDLEVTEVGIHNDKTIEIRSKHPITCWAFSSKLQSSDSYAAFPTNTWGNEYRIISMPNDMYKEGSILSTVPTVPRSGEFLIIATLDNTVVTYTPTANTRNGENRGQPATVTLNKNEVYLVQAAGGAIGTEDLTGTLVRSNNPIGIISGHVRTANKQGLPEPFDTKDHLAEMLMPTKAWGKKFISVPFVVGNSTSTSVNFLGGNDGDLIRVIAKDNNTTVKYFVHKPDSAFDERVTVIQRAGEFFEFEANVPVIWEADKPVQVAQLMMRKSNFDNGWVLQYDPALVILAPVEQYVDEVSFSTPLNSNVLSQYEAHCVIIVTDSLGIYSSFFNGNRIPEGNTKVWRQRIGNSNYYWAMLTPKNGSHRIHSQHFNPDSTNPKFSGIIYGHGFRDSYAMTLGSRLNDPFNIDTVPPIVTWTDSCGTLKIKISDLKINDPNATGIDWGYIRENNNFTVEDFEITDTSTVVDIRAFPTDFTQNALLKIEFFDKELNTVKQEFIYHGFKIEHPQNHNFEMLSWINQTQIPLPIKNIGTGNQNLISITQASDSRLFATINQNFPVLLNPNQTVDLVLTFTPDESLENLDDKIVLNFECHSVEILVFGNIAAPGLVANNLIFEKVRLNDSKVLSGKILNAGNISILIDFLEKDIDENDFIWSFSDEINSNLLTVGDSINYTVEFTPTEIKNYKVVATVVNNESQCSFFVSGEGGAPNIENINIDWRNRRIGTTSDTVIFIKNSGSFDDTVNYKTVVSLTHSEDFSVEIFQQINDIIVQEGQNFPLNFSFVPQDTFAMENIFELTSQWKNHAQIYATVKAQGTIPVIETHDYNFGTHSINSQVPRNPAIINSLGNEILTIDSIVFLSGDSGSFLINYSQLHNFTVEQNESFLCSIIFAPKFSGEHKILLEITHDANPNYLRSTDTVEIIGFATTENSDLILDLILPEIYSCQTVNANVLLKNIGLANITVDSISLKIVPNEIFSAKFIDNISQIFPQELQANEEIILPIEIYAERNKNGILEVSAFYNEENEIAIQKPISPISSTIETSLILSKNLLNPGDTVSLFCRSWVVQNFEKEFNFVINLNFNWNNFAVLEKKCFIEFFTKEGNFILEATVTQFENFVKFEIPTSNIKIDNETIIEFEIKLLTLLAEDKKPRFSFELIFERCCNSEVAILDVLINPVCADGLRQFVFDGFPYLFIKQNPAEHSISFVINLIEDDVVFITLTDLLGNIIYESSDLFLEKGKHNFEIETYSLVSSEYFLTAKSKQLNTTQKIILSK